MRLDNFYNWLMGFLAGAFIVSSLTARFYWNDWGKGDGAALSLGFGVFLAFLGLVATHS